MKNDVVGVRHGARPRGPRALVVAAVMYASLAPVAHAKVKETVLHSFAGGGDGAYPAAPLLADSTGPGGALRALYGTTASNSACSPTCGTVSKLAPKPNHVGFRNRVLELFDGPDGTYPYAVGVIARTRRISDTTPLYGTVGGGGAAGFGTVFSLTGTSLQTLWTFTGGADGGRPSYGDAVVDPSGALYVGTITGGGPRSCGTVIKLTPPAAGQTAWSETTIWTFTGGSDGCASDGLVLNASGALFGTAYLGGSAGDGVVFKLTPPASGQTAWSEQTIWQFQGGSDGNSPGPLSRSANGTLYGTTLGGGGTGCDGSGCGTVFELVPPAKGQTVWNEQVLWRFTGGVDGDAPYDQPIMDKAGVLYATTSAGAKAYGTAFKLTPPAIGQAAWTLATLWTFTGGADGGASLAALTADGKGDVYGTGSAGGAAGVGVVFRLSGTGFLVK